MTHLCFHKMLPESPCDLKQCARHNCFYVGQSPFVEALLELKVTLGLGQ